MQLNFHYALVTGASRGIGAAIAKALAKEGCHLHLCSFHHPEKLRALAAELSAHYGVLCEAHTCDVADEAQVEAMFRQIRSLDLLVNNAAVFVPGALQTISGADYRRMTSTNLDGVFHVCRQAAPLLLQSRGRILNISSVFGAHGASCEAVYAATKGGVDALTRSLAREFAPMGVAVNALAPGVVDTEMNDQLSPEEKEALQNEIPAGRFATSEEIADAALLLFRMPAYLTGQVIAMDGGWM